MHPQGTPANDGFPVVIIGAGPAGLTAAHELSRRNFTSVVLEKSSMAGGLARTEEYKGYLFDIGGHRFYTKVAAVERMWREVLGSDLITRPRLSRIYYNGRFFRYPLEPLNALAGLGLTESILCGLSYAAAKIHPHKPEEDLETWVCNRFGRRLYRTFFKTYTEKVWGIPCREIRAEWAAQRIRGLSLASAVMNALRPRRAAVSGDLRTLIHEFEYPRRGPGMMWQRTCGLIEERGARVMFDADVESIAWEPGRVTGVRASGRTWHAAQFISSMPIRELIERLDPPAPDYLRDAAGDFHYRDFLTVALIVRGKDLFPDNWIYVHDPGVRVGRIQNYNNWSPDMVPDPGTTCLGLEYFCFEGDGLWQTEDAALLELGKKELAALGLLDPAQVIDGTVLRVQKAYPVYDSSYARGVAAMRRFLDTVPNLQLIGRNGMHRYNNQDHSMLTGMLAAQNVMGARHDLWRVNVDADYLEEGERVLEAELAALEATQPAVPQAMGGTARAAQAPPK